LTKLANNAIDNFKKEVLEICGNSYKKRFKDFEDLDNIADILAPLGCEGPELPVHYPRPKRVLTAQVRNFNWFLGNKRFKDKRDRQPYCPKRAAEDNEGLGLVDRDSFYLN